MFVAVPFSLRVFLVCVNLYILHTSSASSIFQSSFFYSWVVWRISALELLATIPITCSSLPLSAKAIANLNKVQQFSWFRVFNSKLLETEIGEGCPVCSFRQLSFVQKCEWLFCPSAELYAGLSGGFSERPRPSLYGISDVQELYAGFRWSIL